MYLPLSLPRNYHCSPCLFVHLFFISVKLHIAHLYEVQVSKIAIFLFMSSISGEAYLFSAVCLYTLSLFLSLLMVPHDHDDVDVAIIIGSIFLSIFLYILTPNWVDVSI